MNARLALLVAIFIGCANAACPPDFVASATIPGKCYYILTSENFNFFDGIGFCRNSITHGADILSIANGFENSEVASLLQSRRISRAYIGNAFYDNTSHWIATAAGSSNYSNWESGTYNGQVAFITSSGSWDYTNGGYDNPAICQIYPDDPTTFPPPQTTCPAGWLRSISVRGKCYQYIGKSDFFSAAGRCLTTGIGGSHAELVTLTSQLEMMELDAMRFNGSWASLTSWEADGHWRWVETLHPTDYFGPYGQPTNYGGTCVFLDRYNLYGAACWGSTAAFCQYFPDEPPAPTLPGLICPQDGIASITKPSTCYYVLSQRQSFQSAQSACQALNTGFTRNDLFVPRTAAEYEEFEAIVMNQISFLPVVPVWLGLTNSNGNWGWVSGRSSNITDMWCSGQPDTSKNPNHQCGFVDPLSIYSNQICWTAGDCTGSRAAVCQSSSTF